MVYRQICKFGWFGYIICDVQENNEQKQEVEDDVAEIWVEVVGVATMAVVAAAMAEKKRAWSSEAGFL